jgi:hypothetical protein
MFLQDDLELYEAILLYSGRFKLHFLPNLMRERIRGHEGVNRMP